MLGFSREELRGMFEELSFRYRVFLCFYILFYVVIGIPWMFICRPVKKDNFGSADPF